MKNFKTSRGIANLIFGVMFFVVLGLVINFFPR